MSPACALPMRKATSMPPGRSAGASMQRHHQIVGDELVARAHQEALRAALHLGRAGEAQLAPAAGEQDHRGDGLGRCRHGEALLHAARRFDHRPARRPAPPPRPAPASNSRRTAQEGGYALPLSSCARHVPSVSILDEGAGPPERPRPSASLAVGHDELGDRVDGLALDAEEAVLRHGLAGLRPAADRRRSSSTTSTGLACRAACAASARRPPA